MIFTKKRSTKYVNSKEVNPRILHIPRSSDLSFYMSQIGVDPDGIRIMQPKGELICMKLYHVESRWCNVLKQELLSIGADLAVSKDLVYKNAPFSDCIIIATLNHIKLLLEKLEDQPPYLKKLRESIELTLNNFKMDEYTFKLPDKTFTIKQYDPLIMGILNLTPDSFSNDGAYRDGCDVEKIIDKAVSMQEEGADIIDIGGESTRPGSDSIDVSEELSRVMPVLKKLVKRISIPISIDTYKSQVAERALDGGAMILNDISGLRHDERMLDIISKYKSGLVIMHMKGEPKTMQQDPCYDDLLGEISSFLSSSIDLALRAGLDKESIIIDPGIGFGKTLEDNLYILRNLEEFKSLGCPILAGPSRKSFIGKVLDVDVEKRLLGTVASVVLAISHGAGIIRVHDIASISQVCKITKSILAK